MIPKTFIRIGLALLLTAFSTKVYACTVFYLKNDTLMKKVIEECFSVDEARAVFEAYYCEDQYKAQYLVGDASFQSMIVEGDNLLSMEEDYLILTNFYHSHPELGGYPCWRYETALSMITESGQYSEYLAGSVLAATHQEGNYPTRYSQIYDLANGLIYLFHDHNFGEYNPIDLKEELRKGARSYDIPGLFAGMRLLAPPAGDTLSSATVEFAWKGKPDYRYELLYSTDANFSPNETEMITVASTSRSGSRRVQWEIAGFLLICPLLFRRTRKSFILLFLAVAVSLVQCKKEEGPEAEDKPVVMKKILTDLDQDRSYFWKIRACPEEQDDFHSETITGNFRTGMTDNN